MKNFALFTLIFFYFAPLLLSEERLWIPEPLKSSAKSIECEDRHLARELQKKVPFSMSCNYSFLKGSTFLIDYVNEQLEIAAKKRFEIFEQVKIVEDDLTKDFGGYELNYESYPVYCSKNLISIFAYEFQHRGCPHGWIHYEGKNFWQKKDSIREIALADLFINGSDWCTYLLQYCDHYLRSLNYGYYGQIADFDPELKIEDLKAFLITDMGITIVFPSYVVGGFADGPDVISIPYSDLSTFIDPIGPLKDMIDSI